jgi:iron complex outermembrane receptor protein
MVRQRLGRQPDYTNVVTEDRDGTESRPGTATNVAPQLRNDYNTRDDWLFSAGLNNEFKFTDELSLLADLSYSSNKRKSRASPRPTRLWLLRHRG